MWEKNAAVMWDDIIRNANKTFSPEEEAAVRSRLGRDAVIMYWAYGYGGRDNQFPYLDEFRDAGFAALYLQQLLSYSIFL